MEKLKSWVPLNFEMMAHPANWVILFLMIAIAGLAMSLITQRSTEA